MEHVGAGARSIVHHAAGDLPEFRRKVAGLQRVFLDLVNRPLRLVGACVGVAAGFIQTIEVNPVVASAKTVDGRIAIRRRRAAIADGLLHAGRQRDEGHGIAGRARRPAASAEVDRQRVDRVTRDVLILLRVLRLQQGHFARYHDRFGGRANLQFSIDTRRLGHLYKDVRRGPFLKPGRFHRDAVRPRGNRRQGILPSRRGLGFEVGAVAGVGRCNVRARHGRTWESVTVPVIVPRSVCANAIGAMAKTATIRTRIATWIRLPMPGKFPACFMIFPLKTPPPS